MNDAAKGNGNKIVIWLFFLSIIAAFGSNLYHFLLKKNYDFLVEASCDPAIEQCFYRDCENSPDDCPPNGLSYYKEYYVKAHDFQGCTDNSCAQECASGSIACTPIACDAAAGDECVDPTIE